MTARDVAGYLLYDEGGHVEFGVFLSVTHQRSGDLFRSRKADINQKITVNRVRQIDVENHARKVSTVVKQDVEMADVAPIIEDVHEALVLCRRAVHLEAMDGPVIGFTYQFDPLAFGSPPIPVIG